MKSADKEECGRGPSSKGKLAFSCESLIQPALFIM